jgi:hypothetical protein
MQKRIAGIACMLSFCLAAMGLLSGCSSVASRTTSQGFDTALRPTIRTIGLVAIPEPSSKGTDFDEPSVVVFDPQTGHGVLAAIESDQRSEKLRRLLESQRWSFSASMTAALTKHLETAGYSVTIVTPPSNRDERDFLPDYDAFRGKAESAHQRPPRGNADAYLDLFALQVGFVRTGGSLVPYAAVPVRLATDVDGLTRYAGLIEFGAGRRFPGKELPVGDAPVFENFDAVTRGSQAAAALDKAVDAIARRIAQDLR